MIDLKYLRNHLEDAKVNCQRRHSNVDLEQLLAIDETVRHLKSELDDLRRQRNELNTQMKAPLSKEEREPLIAISKEMREQEQLLEQKYAKVFHQRQELWKAVPNWTHPDTPDGKDDTTNHVLKEVGKKPQFDFEPQDHLTLMKQLDWLDFEGGAKVTGNKFYYLKNEAVFLELALVQFAMRLLSQKGFTTFITPDLARSEIIEGLGFQPRGEETQIYAIEDSDLCLVATAEITLGGRLKDELLHENDLPFKHAGFSHCFRTESGAAGRESKGLFRVHQFSKVEMFVFVKPEDSDAMHQELLEIEEEIYQRLEIPYRVVDVCCGDLGSPAYRKYDLEAWMPGRNEWGEITSASNCTDYQARRLNIRYKDSEGNKHFVHLLNGTAVAVSRVLVALVENNQKADGSISIPPALIPFMPQFEKKM